MQGIIASYPDARFPTFTGLKPSTSFDGCMAFIIFSLLIPVLAFFLIRFFAQQDLSGMVGSSILYRIGISGDDIHNGGLLGALQFLGGNRIQYFE